METDAATHTRKLLLIRNPEYWDINIVLWYISAKYRSVPKHGLITLKLDWFKSNAGTNTGQQNNLYLSAPVQHFTRFSSDSS